MQRDTRDTSVMNISAAFERPALDRDQVRAEFEKIIGLEDGSLIDRARALGVTLKPKDLVALAPIALDFGIVNDFCDRTKFALQVAIGSSNPGAMVETEEKGRVTLWEAVVSEINKRPDFYDGAFAPITMSNIPSSLVPGIDQPKMPQYQVWH